MTQTRTILVVDDDPEFRALVRPALEQRGLAVLEAGTAREATQAMARSSPDLVIVDGLLPDVKGMAWIADLRRQGNRVPVVFVSAFWKDLHSFRHLTSELGVAVVTHKPVSASMLAGQVEQVLGTPSIPEPEVEIIAEPEPDDIEAVIAGLRLEYLRALPEKVAAVSSAVAAARAKPADPGLRREARSLAHRLRGTAGSFGAPEVGDVAGRVEDLLVGLDESPLPALRDMTWSRLEQELRRLVHAARIVSGTFEPVTSGAEDSAHRGRVLVVDADLRVRGALGDLGRRHLLDIRGAATAAEAVAEARARRFDCAVLDMAGGEAAVKLAHELRSIPGCETLPLAFTSGDTTVESRVAAAHAGASLFLVKPLDGNAFQHAVEQLLAIARPRRPRVLVIDDDPDFARQVTALLATADIAAHQLHDPLGIFEVLDQVEPDVVLLDSIMPGMNGLDVCRMLRTTPRWQDLPVIFITVDTGSDLRLAAYEAGVDDYLTKPVIAPELLARVRVRLERARLIRERMSTDALTGLLLRRTFLEVAGGRLAEARRYKRPLTVVLLDLDGFKEINDRHGHLAGDAVLSGIGRLLTGRLRAEDLRARWGGEEFALLFAGQTAETMAIVVERLRQELAQMPFRGEDNEPFTVSFSAGVAQYGEDGDSIEALLGAADRRLYAAKRSGRSRVAATG